MSGSSLKVVFSESIGARLKTLGVEDTEEKDIASIALDVLCGCEEIEWFC
jgi:hypothetical protein